MIEITSGAYQACCGSGQGAYLMSPGYELHSREVLWLAESSGSCASINITHQLHLTWSKKNRMCTKTVALTSSCMEIVFLFCNYVSWEILAS
jgi:hypothetical protein